MLEQVLMHLNNWFVMPGEIYGGPFRIEGGSIALPYLQKGQYFRICGSVFNDGLHQYPCSDLTDEEFDGTVWCLAIPKAVISLSSDISDWQKKYGNIVNSPYQSESFQNYSYSKGASANSSIRGWQDAFRGRLDEWRKI